MDQDINYQKLKENWLGVETPPALESRLLSHLLTKEKRRIWRQNIILGITNLSALVFLVLGVGSFSRELSSGGFYHLAELVLVDSQLVLNYWPELILSLVESLPLFGLALLLAVGALSILLTQSIIKQNFKNFNWQIKSL